MNPTASNPSLSMTAFLSRPNTIGIHPDDQEDAGCYNSQSKIPTPKAKPQSLSRQRDIRRALIEADLVDCMVALPGQLFYSTQIPVCLWFLAKNKAADAKRGFRDRRAAENVLSLAA